MASNSRSVLVSRLMVLPKEACKMAEGQNHSSHRVKRAQNYTQQLHIRLRVTTTKHSALHSKLWLTCVRGLDPVSFTKSRHQHCKIGKLVSNQLGTRYSGLYYSRVQLLYDKRLNITGTFSFYTVHSPAYEPIHLASGLRD
jgi:hypothetical protein